MAVRDPETGQFVSSKSDITGQADEVLQFHGGMVVDDGTNDTKGDHHDKLKSLNFQKDYEIVGLHLQLVANGRGVAGGSTSAPGSMAPASALLQVATTSGFANAEAAKNGGLEPAGVYWTDHAKVTPPSSYEDDTNGTGGLANGNNYEKERWIHADDIVNADTNPSAGTTLNIHGRVEGVCATNGDCQFELYVRVYVRERDE